MAKTYKGRKWIIYQQLKIQKEIREKHNMKENNKKSIFKCTMY